TPARHAAPADLPGGDVPSDLAAATSAAHAAAAIAAGEAERRRAGGAVPPTRDLDGQGRPLIEPPAAPAEEPDFGSGILGEGDGVKFADEVQRILGDPRSWIASGQFRLQRVPESSGSEFTIYLASADTSEKMCAAGGLKTDGYTSCRLPGQVIINLDRWEDAV